MLIRSTAEDKSVKERVLFISQIPLKGIRVVCKGPNYKARRKRKFFFHTWVSDDWMTGKMPGQSLDAQVDYYQSFAIQTQASIGIKV